MTPPQSPPGELRGSQWSVCPAASNSPGLHISGLYMYNSCFHIYSVDNNLHAALFTPVDRQSVQHGSDVCFHDFTLSHSYHLLFQLLEDNIVSFVRNQLKKIKTLLSSDYPECSESQGEDEGEDEEQRRSSREAFLKITLYFLRRMKEEELAECLQSSKRISLKV